MLPLCLTLKLTSEDTKRIDEELEPLYFFLNKFGINYRFASSAIGEAVINAYGTVLVSKETIAVFVALQRKLRLRVVGPQFQGDGEVAINVDEDLGRRRRRRERDVLLEKHSRAIVGDELLEEILRVAPCEPNFEPSVKY